MTTTDQGQPQTVRKPPPDSVTGVHLAQGIGAREAKGFWADAWEQVLRRPGAWFGLAWAAILCFFACFAPFIANGHPYILRVLDDDGAALTISPLVRNLSSTDVVVALFGLLVPIIILFPARAARSRRLLLLIAIAGQASITLLLTTLLRSSDRIVEAFQPSPGTAMTIAERLKLPGTLALPFPGAIEHERLFIPIIAAAAVTILFVFLMPIRRWAPRIATAALIGIITCAIATIWWIRPLANFTPYTDLLLAGRTQSAIYAPIPFSPSQRPENARLLEPGQPLSLVAIRDQLPKVESTILSPADMRTLLDGLDDLRLTTDQISALKERAVETAPRAAELAAALSADAPEWSQPTSDGITSKQMERALETAAPAPHPILGTDLLGQDVASQMIHACRLAISIGLVSTGISVILGITLGAMMGYFGGVVDLLLFRVVEIFMAVPLLLLLIVGAAVLPKNTYITMALIGGFTWPNAARFIRAEFFKLRNQDFVQAAKAVGLPMPAIVFKHILPNGITPVLVDTSFAIATAILFESTLSFLGLGPADQASWGRLLAAATNQIGTFVPHLAIVPGLAIFLSVLSFTLIGEALRDAIDPKLKKARV